MHRIPEPVLSRIKNDLESYKINFPELYSRETICVLRMGEYVEVSQRCYLEEGISEQINSQYTAYQPTPYIRNYGVYHCGTNNDDGVISPTVHFTMFKLKEEEKES